MNTIIQNPEVAEYVQHWSTESAESALDRGNWDLKCLGIDRLLLENAACCSAWIEEMSKNINDPLLGVVLALLPNLSSLDCYLGGTDTELSELGTMLKRLTSFSTPVTSRPLPLSNLVRVTLGMAEERDWYPRIGSIELFAALPSVRIINAAHTEGSLNDIVYKDPPSNFGLTDLNISNRRIIPKRFMLLMDRFTTLASCTYWPDNEIEDDDAIFDPFLIIRALISSSRRSLRELLLRSNKKDTDVYMGSLLPFTYLDQVEFDLWMLCRNDDSWTFRSKISCHRVRVLAEDLSMTMKTLSPLIP